MELIEHKLNLRFTEGNIKTLLFTVNEDRVPDRNNISERVTVRGSRDM